MENNYAVKITAKISEFIQNMKTVQQQMTLTGSESKKFQKAMERSLSSANPKAQLLGRNMKALSDTYSDQAAKFKEASNTVLEYQQQLDSLSQRYTAQQDAVNDTKEKLAELEKAYADAKTNANNFSSAKFKKEGGDGYLQLKAKVTQAALALDTCRGSLTSQQEVLASLEKEVNSYTDALNNARGSAANLSEMLTNTANGMRQMSRASSSLTKVGSFFKSLGSKAASLATTVGRVATKFAGFAVNVGKNAVGGIAKFISHARELHQRTNLIGGAVKKLTGSFGSLANVFARRFKRGIATAVFGELKETLQSVAKESTSFNASMSSMIASYKTFTNQIASAVAPIINAVAPVISRVIDLFTAAADKVSQFTAILTGNNTYLKANKVQYDYAASVDKTASNSNKAASSIKKQAEETKKLQRTIMSFDELHTLNADDDSSSTSSTDSGNEETEQPSAPNFSTQEASAFSGLAERLRNAFNAGDWNALGKAMADGINGAFAWVDNIIKWENCGERISAVCNAIVETFNSLVHNVDWTLIGKTIADGVDTIVNTFSIFAYGIDWTGLGLGLGQGVKSIFDNVHWDNLGALVVEGFQIPIRMLNGFVSTPGLFESAGTALKNAFKGMIDQLDPTLYGDTLAKTVNGIFEFIEIGFSDFAKFEELGMKLASNVNTAIDGIKPEQIANGLSNFCIAILTAITTALENIHWQELGEKTAEFLSKVKWGAIFDKLSEGIGAALGGLAGFVWGLLKGAWNKAMLWWKSVAFKDGKFTITGLLNGILQALINIGNWIIQHIVDPFIKGFKKAFGIASPSTKMKTQGGFIVSGMLEGIKNKLLNIPSWIKTHVFDKFMNGFKNAFGINGEKASSMLNMGKNLITSIKSGLEEKVSDVKDFFTNLPSTISEKISSGWGTLKGIGESIMSNIQSGLSSFGIKLPHFTITGEFDLNPLNFHIPSIGVEWYASGGFPEDGLFMANHNELVGQFSNGKTAVANNEQIVEGITNGVYNAVAPLVVEILSAMQQKDEGSQVVEIDGERLARVVTKYQKKIHNREYAF